MPGLIGVFPSRAVSAPIEERFMRGLDLMGIHGRFESESLVDPGAWALGRVHLGVLQPTRQLDAENHVHVLVHGDAERIRQTNRRRSEATPRR